MKNILDKNDLLKPPRIGEIVEGIIIGKGRAATFLDLGAIGTGIIYGKEFYEAKDRLRGLKKGDKIFAKIVDLENEDGFIELSISSASKELAFDILTKNKERGEILKVKILGANKGGLMAEVSGMPAFLPVSQLASSHYPKVEGGEKTKILRELQKLVGKELEVKIIDLSQRNEQIILSEKAKEIDEKREILKNYKVGDIVEGEITGITDFGAFMKFSSLADLSAETKKAKVKALKEKGSVSEGKELPSPEVAVDESFTLEGLIHISELDWKIIENPIEIVKVGEKIRAKIIEIEEGKVFLSLKALKKDPWEGIEKKYMKGEQVSGKVTKINPFGSFVQITPEIQGLCHISEFGGKKIEEILEIGKEYKFQILLLDEKEHKMNLKLVKE